jgi:hypothetical protein
VRPRSERVENENEFGCTNCGRTEGVAQMPCDKCRGKHFKQTELNGFIVREIDNKPIVIIALNEQALFSIEVERVVEAIEAAEPSFDFALKHGRIYAGRSPLCECCMNKLSECSCFGEAPDLTDEEITGKTAEQVMSSLDSVGYKKGAL